MINLGWEEGLTFFEGGEFRIYYWNFYGVYAFKRVDNVKSTYLKKIV